MDKSTGQNIIDTYMNYVDCKAKLKESKHAISNIIDRFCLNCGRNGKYMLRSLYHDIVSLDRDKPVAKQQFIKLVAENPQFAVDQLQNIDVYTYFLTVPYNFANERDPYIIIAENVYEAAQYVIYTCSDRIITWLSCANVSRGSSSYFMDYQNMLTHGFSVSRLNVQGIYTKFGDTYIKSIKRKPKYLLAFFILFNKYLSIEHTKFILETIMSSSYNSNYVTYAMDLFWSDMSNRFANEDGFTEINDKYNAYKSLLIMKG